ncbi:MAG: DUF4118 domain-containing protein, partial [Gemmatimonadales bacterium]
MGTLALASTGIALGLALGLRPVLAPVVATLFLLAVAVTALSGGLWPGLLATVLSVLALNFWFFPPAEAFGFASATDLIQQLVFALSAMLIAALLAQSRVARLAAEARMREQGRYLSALADLGRRVLRGADLQTALEDAAATVARTLDVPQSGILELLPSRDTVLLRAGQGWRDGLPGHATVRATQDSLVGRALAVDAPTIVAAGALGARDDEEILTEHGVSGAALVPISSPAGRFGLLGAFTAERHEFVPEEIGFLQAVADLLAAELRREHLERVFRESATDGIVMLDRDGRITFANRRAGEIAGRTALELFGRTIWDVMPTLVASPYEEKLRRAMEQQIPSQAELFAPGVGRVDSGVFPTQDGLVLVWSSVGPQLRALEAAGAGSWEWDVEAGKLSLSPAMSELHGIPPDRAIDLTELLDRIHPMDRERVGTLLARSVSERTDCALEYRVPRGLDLSRLVVARGRVVGEGGGTPLRMIGIAMALPDPDQLLTPRLAEPPVATDARMVLVVQSDATARQLITQSLEREGVRWLTAADAAEALVLLDRYDIPIHLLVTDLQLPDLSGDELVNRVRERYPALPVIYVP